MILFGCDTERGSHAHGPKIHSDRDLLNGGGRRLCKRSGPTANGDNFVARRSLPPPASRLGGGEINGGGVFPAPGTRLGDVLRCHSLHGLDGMPWRLLAQRLPASIPGSRYFYEWRELALLNTDQPSSGRGSERELEGRDPGPFRWRDSNSQSVDIPREERGRSRLLNARKEDSTVASGISLTDTLGLMAPQWFSFRRHPEIATQPPQVDKQIRRVHYLFGLRFMSSPMGAIAGPKLRRPLARHGQMEQFRRS